MKRLPVLACALLLVAGCGGGGTAPVDPPPPDREPALHTTGEFRLEPVGMHRNAATAFFHNWGVWGGVLRDDVATCAAIGCPPGGDEIFWAFLTSDADGTVVATVTGTPSGTSPVGGSAVWSGDVHAYETKSVATPGSTAATMRVPVEGDARLEVDFTTAAVDVEFTGFDNQRADLSWPSLAMNGGAFGNAAAGIQGVFYGTGHEGAAGTFQRDGLAGVFGALRVSE